jgi:hypothetical protein
MKLITSYIVKDWAGNVLDFNQGRIKLHVDLWLLYSDRFDGEVLTSAALMAARSYMTPSDLKTHSSIPIDRKSAKELLKMRDLDLPLDECDIMHLIS